MDSDVEGERERERRREIKDTGQIALDMSDNVNDALGLLSEQSDKLSINIALLQGTLTSLMVFW